MSWLADGALADAWMYAGVEDYKVRVGEAGLQEVVKMAA
jgi:hypothetical protein